MLKFDYDTEQRDDPTPMVALKAAGTKKVSSMIMFASHRGNALAHNQWSHVD